jgi:hypothetical protein
MRTVQEAIGELPPEAFNAAARVAAAMIAAVDARTPTAPPRHRQLRGEGDPRGPARAAGRSSKPAGTAAVVDRATAA